jgi:hypothetical protein
MLSKEETSRKIRNSAQIAAASGPIHLFYVFRNGL